MDRKIYEESKNKAYDVIRNARSEIERLQFREGLHNDLTESVKQTLVSLENRLLNDRVLKPERLMLKKYQEQIAKKDRAKAKSKRAKAPSKKIAEEKGLV